MRDMHAFDTRKYFSVEVARRNGGIYKTVCGFRFHGDKKIQRCAFSPHHFANGCEAVKSID